MFKTTFQLSCLCDRLWGSPVRRASLFIVVLRQCSFLSIIIVIISFEISCPTVLFVDLSNMWMTNYAYCHGFLICSLYCQEDLPLMQRIYIKCMYVLNNDFKLTQRFAFNVPQKFDTILHE